MSEQVTINAKQVTINAEQLTNNTKDSGNAVGIGFGVLILYICFFIIYAAGLGIGTLLFSILGMLLMAGGDKPMKSFITGMCTLGALLGFAFFLMF